MKRPVAPLGVPADGWPSQGLCYPGKTSLDPSPWDAQGEGETDLQRRARQAVAMSVCDALCPVQQQCLTTAQQQRRRRQSPGVRGGVSFG